MSDGEPASGRELDATALRRALGCFVTGVTVVTAGDADGGPHGFTANSFTSVSLDPPLVLVCVGREVEGLEVYRECEGFAVNVLAESQRAISETFAADRPDRFAGVPWRVGKYGAPILDDCIACLECASWQRIEAGDHLILIGRVLAFERSPGRPLAFCHGRYVSLSDERAGIARDDTRAVRPAP